MALGIFKYGLEGMDGGTAGEGATGKGPKGSVVGGGVGKGPKGSGVGGGVGKGAKGGGVGKPPWSAPSEISSNKRPVSLAGLGESSTQ